ncbi:MAG: DMT family transporter [Ignavibacteriales bacterium]|nr:DMT family transporter [Ignavibacteriales bacterium]
MSDLNQNIPYLGELSALLTAFLWAGSSMAFASATKRLGSFNVNISRLLLAAAYLIVLIPVAGFDIGISLKQGIYLCASGVVGLSIGDTFLFKSYQLIGARVTMLMMSLAPAIAALLSYYILNESISFTGIVGIIITIAGIVLVVIDRESDGFQKNKIIPLGIIYAFIAAAGQGAGLVLAKMAFQEGSINGFVATGFRIIASLILILPFAILTKRYGNPIKTFRGNSTAFWLTISGSFLGPFFGITFSLIAIANTNVGIASTIMAMVPILMLPLVKFIYKEKLTMTAIIGSFIAVGGVVVLFLR